MSDGDFLRKYAFIFRTKVPNYTELYERDIVFKLFGIASRLDRIDETNGLLERTLDILEKHAQSIDNKPSGDII